MIVTVKKSADLVVPSNVRRRAGIRDGDRVEFKVSSGVIIIVPKKPVADDEYTPDQRRVVDAQLAEGLDDIRKGRVSRRFDTVDEMLASMKAGKGSSISRKTRLR